MKKVRIQDSRFKIQDFMMAVFVFSLFLYPYSFTPAASAAEWGGVDESVVEKYAEEHGRAPMDPLINTDQGDLLLFVFLLGGAVGGFMAGYYWRELMERKPGKVDNGSKVAQR